MSNELVTSILQVFGSGGFAVALVKGIEAVSKHRQHVAEVQAKAATDIATVEADATKVSEREATERHRLKQEEIVIAEKMVLDRAEEHRAAIQQVIAAEAAAAAARAEAAAARAEAAKVDAIAAECQRDRHEMHDIIKWLRGRLDKLDGGSLPPPVTSFTSDAEPAE